MGVKSLASDIGSYISRNRRGRTAVRPYGIIGVNSCLV